MPISHVQHALIHFLVNDLPFRINPFDIAIPFLGTRVLQRIASLVFFTEDVTNRKEKNKITDIRSLEATC